jgi:type I restriction enzyme S subunit
MLKPYKEYRYFGLPWLEEVPSHWTMMRNKNVLIEKKEVVGSSSNNYLLLSLTLNGVIARDMINAKGKFPKDFNTYKVVEPGNLIFCLFDIDETPRTVGLSPLNGMITGAYDVFQPVNINGKYLYYYYLSIDNVKGLKPLYTGLRKVINIQTFLGTKLPVPPKEEQNQIVRFLDWKLAKINKLIRAKKKQIALLNEQRQVIIHNAVTKGVDPNVPMKDSGIEWIGQIPQEWVVNRLKTQISLSTSKKNRDNEFYVGMENIQSWTGKYVSTTEIDSEGICNIFENNNILFGKLRPYLAKVYLTENNGVCSSEFLVLKNFNGILRYMFYILLSYKFIDLVNSSTYGAKMPRANWSFIGNCNIPIPSLEDQNRIASYLDEKCYKIENLKGKIQNEIDLLYEYRTRLISDVVTGKVDVRDIEIPEYEADSDETIDDEIDDNLVLDEEDGEMEVE